MSSPINFCACDARASNSSALMGFTRCPVASMSRKPVKSSIGREEGVAAIASARGPNKLTSRKSGRIVGHGQEECKGRKAESRRLFRCWKENLLCADRQNILTLDLYFHAKRRANVAALNDGPADPNIAQYAGGFQWIVKRAAAGMQPVDDSPRESRTPRAIYLCR